MKDFKIKHEAATRKVSDRRVRMEYKEAFLLQVNAIESYLYALETKAVEDDYITLPFFCIRAAEYAITARSYAEAIKWAEFGLSRKFLEPSLRQKLDALRIEAICWKKLFDEIVNCKDFGRAVTDFLANADK